MNMLNNLYKTLSRQIEHYQKKGDAEKVKKLTEQLNVAGRTSLSSDDNENFSHVRVDQK